MRPLRVFLCDFSYFNSYTEFGLYVPLNIGFLAAYAKKKFGHEVDFTLFKDPEVMLRSAAENAPDLVGMSFYYWNSALNRLVAGKLRALCGDDVKIVWGGPSVDTDRGEQRGLFQRFPEVDAFVANEGEIGFANVISHILSKKQGTFTDPLDGVVFQAGDDLVEGLPIGLTTDLGDLGSPYLLGLLDPFIDGKLLPIIQTSRLCPYTCAFCVSGKSRGKLRAFPMEQVCEEIEYLSRKYSDRPNFTLYISDENFGILKRDVEIAEHIRDCAEKFRYPRKLFFYNDKRFTETSRKVHETVGDMCLYGLTLSLQSENPDTLAAIKRRNLTPEQLATAIDWASEKNLPTTTELIFGLPAETLDSFTALLNKCSTSGFDSIQCYNLIVLDGIELNRPVYRKEHGLVTKFRHVSASYHTIGSDFCAEAEEVVVSSDAFSFDDFLLVRGLNLMFHAIFYLKLYHEFFKYICEADIPLADFLCRFLRPDIDDESLPAPYLKYLSDFQASAKGELFDTREDVVAYMNRLSNDAEGAVVEPIKITPHYGMRLIQHEMTWVAPVLRKILKSMVPAEGGESILRTANFLLELGDRERVDFKAAQVPKPLETDYDVLAWKSGKFRQPLETYRKPSSRIVFTEGARLLEAGADFRKRAGEDPSGHFAHQEAEDFYFYAIGHFTLSPIDLLYEMSYTEGASAAEDASATVDGMVA